MSAHIVTDDTIRAIVTFAMRQQMFPALDRVELGQMLLDENYASVNHRYRENGAAHRYIHKDLIVGYCKPNSPPRTLTALDIVKLCQCLDYQSCEHDGWRKSAARGALKSIQNLAITKIPGYDEAPWGLH